MAGMAMISQAPYDVFAVADAILKITKERGRQLTPMQLVKLTYITHGFSLAIRNKPLFYNDIEAWKYGPVIPKLYHATKEYGRNPIPFSVIGDSQDIDIAFDDKQLVEKVLDKYQDLDGITLSYLTHKPGTPWSQVYNLGVNMPIDDEMIKKHYQELVAHGRH
ncbi:Panacea domain-containing protein [Moraxella caviae]|nr:type II toxin-antitoxin system antitoxin SocA domain-containing protein [Moraxella caviae]